LPVFFTAFSWFVVAILAMGVGISFLPVSNYRFSMIDADQA